MAKLYPFRALRPTPAEASRVAAVPYDVVTVDEARILAGDNQLSFLRVSRPELEMPPGTDPHSDAVYRRAVENFARLKQSHLEIETESSLYFYRLRTRDHEQVGLAGCFSIDDYERDVIKKHERTRRDKEDDRTRHIVALGAQTGAVFLTYRASADVNDIAARIVSGAPLFDFEAVDAVRHTIWQVTGADRDALVRAFTPIEALYIADGHHRAASAARARQEPGNRAPADRLAGAEDVHTAADVDGVLAVAFPHDQVQILPYNRIVTDLAGQQPADFLSAINDRFHVSPGPAVPVRRGDIAMYFQGGWHTLRPRITPDGSDPIASLDVSVLQDGLLGPILHIVDVRTDERIDFVGGARGTGELERHVQSGKFAVAFSLFPVSVADLMAVSDAGAIMPPKSTWFEPKLRDGLLIHAV
jgi:uncharacterized protein (DUF1015 family)